jgi:TonB family protein
VAPGHAASCTSEYQPASIVQPAAVDYPQIAQLEHLTGKSVIQVDLDADGSLLAAYVAHTSGYAILDQAAIRTVKKMVYSPETRDCKPTHGSYAVEVEFED